MPPTDNLKVMDKIQVDKIPIPLFILDTDGNVLSYNDSFRELIKGRKALEEKFKENVEFLRKKIKTEPSNVPEMFEIPFEDDVYLLDVSRISDDSGYVCVVADITKTKKIENELAVLNMTIERAPISIIITDKNREYPVL